jgi:predicted adenylyl cyclase CyaB
VPRNVEIKARVDDPETIRRRLRRLGADGPYPIAQHDVFFHSRRGRLKLRHFDDGSGELIAYSRADETGPATSHYRIVPCADPETLRTALAESLGVLGEVRKRRALWLLGRTRVHLDEVAGLGDFLELEVVLDEAEAQSAGEREAGELMETLGVDSSSLVAGAYIDLLLG